MYIQDGLSRYDKKIYRHIPISYTTAVEKEFSCTVPKLWLWENQTFHNTGFTNDTWLLFNLQQTGQENTIIHPRGDAFTAIN